MLEELTAGSNYTPSSSLSNMLELTAWKLFHTQKNPSVCRVIGHNYSTKITTFYLL